MTKALFSPPRCMVQTGNVIPPAATITLPPQARKPPIAAGAQCSISDDSGTTSDSRYASGMVRNHVWPYVKFILCEDDKNIDAPMAQLLFEHIMTPHKQMYWEINKNLFAKSIQMKRSACSNSVKERFIGR